MPRPALRVSGSGESEVGDDDMKSKTSQITQDSFALPVILYGFKSHLMATTLIFTFNNTSFSAGNGSNGEANGEASAMQELISSTDFFLEKGPQLVVAATRKAVEEETSSLQPETAVGAPGEVMGRLLVNKWQMEEAQVSTSSLSSFFKDVFQKVEKDPVTHLT